MGLWTLLEGFLLLANALAILNEDRFLAPRGWSFSEFSGGKSKSFKGQLIGLIYATQYLRVPLILLNSIFVVVKYHKDTPDCGATQKESFSERLKNFVLCASFSFGVVGRKD
ncbi:immediate early response 3-interacting protein 1 [Quercus suber]|uniref:Immediate early response 3-interacting protein 1 n=1 Tax=Quercus suber TaxID=58331 RepID=A0AAW0KWZ8_QUESU